MTPARLEAVDGIGAFVFREGVRRSLLSLALALAAHAGAGQVAAQAPEDTETAAAADASDGEARALFERGMALTQQGQWSDALPLFDRAFALSGEPAALYNYAITLRALGRHVEALRGFEQLLTLEVNDAMREEATTMAREERRRLGALVILAAAGTPTTVALRVDARPVEVEHWPARVVVDPGTHVVDATLQGHRPIRVERAVAEGAEESVELEFEAIPQAIVAPPPSGRGWIAGVVVGAAVAVGVAVVLAVLLGGGSEPLQPRAGTVEVPL